MKKIWVYELEGKFKRCIRSKDLNVTVKNYINYE